jgi:hypothetical protein
MRTAYLTGEAMNEPRSQQLSPAGAGRRAPAKFLPALATVLLVGLSLYASRAAVRPATAPARPEQAGGAAKGDAGVTAKAVAAANAFLESLDAAQRDTALLAYDSAKKPRWSNLPVTFVPRNGVRLGDLTRKQRGLAMEVLAAVLSKGGYQKVVDIMDGDQQLAEGKGGKGKGGKGGKGGKPAFGVDQYYLAFFGKPSATQPWMVQFGGHHLGLNVTIVGKDAVLTPTHTGAQPTAFMRDGRTVRPLGPENDLAFKLINLLDAKQRAQAVRGARPRNLALGPGQDGKTIPPEGIKGSALSDMQRGLLLELIGAWVQILPDADADRRLKGLKGELGETYFAWYGPTTDGSAVYYRVQGPSLVIEYAPQGGTDHIHTIIRDPGNDYGKQLTRR